ncbi:MULTISPECIES: DUF2459 domain-containing protein [Cupriavidus]|jgi:hypothetical protein|uniref:DUF2459 domain-containing protein n=1 Tax=Cupriavidus sp. KB_39 TaxID=3233036 RepID=UPI003F93A0C4
MRAWRWLVGSAMAATLAGCNATPAAAPVTPVTTIDVVEGDWHTELCIRTEDADARLLRLTVGYAGSRFLCFGFGDRQYLLSRERGPMTLISALFPGEGAILLTILRDTPAAAYGAGNVVRLALDEAGISQLREFLGDAVQTDASDKPIGLGDGPYEGGVYFAATATYAGFYTCNTWTAHALRTAGVPVRGPVLFAEGVMRQVREIAAAAPEAP